MKYLVYPTAKLQALGYDTTPFRKSVDGSVCVVHLDFISTLYPAITSEPDALVYDYASNELNAILNGAEFTPAEGVVTTATQPNQTLAERVAQLEDTTQVILTTLEVAP